MSTVHTWRSITALGLLFIALIPLPATNLQAAAVTTPSEQSPVASVSVNQPGASTSAGQSGAVASRPRGKPCCNRFSGVGPPGWEPPG